MHENTLQSPDNEANEALGPLGLLKRPAIRQACKLVLDTGVAALSWVVATSLVRQELPTLYGVASWVAFAMAVNLAFRYTSQHFRLLGIEEAESFIFGTIVMVSILLLASVFQDRLGLDLDSRNLLLVAGLITCPMWLALRLVFVAGYHRLSQRRFATRDRLNPVGNHGQSVHRTLIVGAGRAGALLCQELRANPQLQCEVVGFVDDALEKQGVRIHGIPVLGHSHLLPIFIKECQATQVILAMPRVPGAKLKQLSELLQIQGVRVKTVPGISNLIGDRPWKPELRDIAIEDLLRREPVTLDLTAISQEVEGSVVLITGAGGSIGSELARQVAPFRPGRLVLLGRGENSLWEVERDLRRQFPGMNLAVELCDIRNSLRLQRAFESCNPAIVFHAAAHKHVPFLERNPEEAIENNIFGTLNVLKAALAGNVRIFVNISTDKAVNPTNVLGVSKRIAESLVMQAADEAPADRRFVSVRFGNVLGSRGSVIPLFRDQIRTGGPLTVTHPDMTRYFMTIPEASQLVLQAGVLGETGKVFVLNMGEPVRIVDMAMDMARLSGLNPGIDIDIQFTGMRPGEKLYEELFMDSEHGNGDPQAKVFEAMQPPPDPWLLDVSLHKLREAIHLPEGQRQREMLRCFKQLVPSYQPSSQGLGRYAEAASGPSPPVLEEVPLFN
ncbi:nucleoside-diphosphate sugar epimerase/dehydratase [Geothrix sp. SG200]|uniref:polysaccharide biosynthesis protein n=1 Tax=Geothrix sp. SG200 TaxID=2922865 RepID=UPI001FABA6CC|nr:nucleoside-diphosphate sugar epimerase/dehydratase [Geothrix sp. SG200]